MKNNIIKMYINRLVTSILMLIVSLTTFAQQQPAIEMADKFRADGKIYVVIGVFAIVMAVMFIFLFSLDRKIRQLENEIKN